MARLFVALLCLALSGVCFASQFRQLAAGLQVPENLCDAETNRKFETVSAVLRNGPGGLLQATREIFLTYGGTTSMCLRSRNVSNHGLWMAVDKSFDDHNFAGCCTMHERIGMDADDNGNLLPFAQEALDDLEKDNLMGVDYVQIAPDSCPSGCPLVVEISGNGGHPWLMMRYKCQLCRSELGVLMASPLLPLDEDTSARYVNDKFVPFVKALLDRNSFRVDAQRAYIVSASRGNEIAFTAALAHPELFRSVLSTGKFRFTDDMWDLVSTPGIYETAGNAGLETIILNIGDEDPIFTDEEFYSNFTRAMRPLSGSPNGPHVRLNIYPFLGHGTSPGVWTRWSSVIWSGSRDPFQAF